MTSDPLAVAPPEQPGWYPDAHGAWWWWDGASWTPAAGPVAAPAGPDRTQERTTALVMWIVFIVGGGWIAALIFYLVAKDKAFVRHHAAEALNLSIVLLVPQILALVLLLPGYLAYLADIIASSGTETVGFSPGPAFWAGIGLFVLLTVASYGLSIAAAVQASKGRWWRHPIPFHPVRGVVAKGEEPYSVL